MHILVIVICALLLDRADAFVQILDMILVRYGVKAVNADPGIDALYSDEDKISMNGKEYFEPHFKTDFNIDLLLIQRSLV